jgi:membrane-bound metal-dependent hydrolase YbcI (DUF457 family)
MPDLLTHFAIAFALIAPFLGIKKALIAGIIALIPDIDVLLHLHRYISHSIIVLLISTLPIAYLISKIGIKWKTSILMIIALITHPILDMFQSYTPILYPLFSSIFIDVRSGFLLGKEISPYFDLIIHTKSFDFTPFVSMDGPLFTNETLPISFVLIIVPILYSLLKSESVKSNHEYK